MSNRTDRSLATGRPVIVTSAGGQVLARVPISRAATLIATELAYSLDIAPLLAVVRSPSLTVKVHQVISITKAAYRPWAGRTADSYASNHAVLTRDRHRCAYCLGAAATVDHVLPASRGGGSTFGNLVAACGPCNTAKADRTPEEAGMPLHWAPYVHDPWAPDQEFVHSLFLLDGD